MKKLLKMTLLALALAPGMALAQQQFSSPDEAASALAEAIGRHDESALNELLGDSWQQFYRRMASTLTPSLAFSVTGRLATVSFCRKIPPGWR